MVDELLAEPNTSEAVVRALLSAECPQWVDVGLDRLDGSGTEHAMWRGWVSGAPAFVVRLPRRPSAVGGAVREPELLQRLTTTALPSVVAIPQLLHLGGPHELYPHPWSVLSWLDGRDAWSARDEIDGDSPRLAAQLAEVVASIGALGDGLPAPEHAVGDAVLPIRPHLDFLLESLDSAGPDADHPFDVALVRRLAAESYDVDDPTTTCFVHGDLIPGNVLVHAGEVTGVLDWGAACYGDQARDLAPAWSILGPIGRRAFRELLGVDDATWARGRALELCHAVDAVLRYVPQHHPIGDVMAATLQRILTDI